MTDTNGVTQYSYDVLDRLSSVTYPSAPTTTAYSYDGVGNRLTQQVDANPATAYTYDEADQLTTVGGAGNLFDQNGNLLSVGATIPLLNTFLYDQENRLFRTGPCRGEVDGNGIANSIDKNDVAQHTGIEGSAAYDLNLDVTGDGVINSNDVNIATQDASKQCKSTGPNTGNGRSWYDGDGLRVRQRTFTGPNQTPKVDDDYTWDAGAVMPVVLQDTRTPQGGAAAATTYLYGLGLISETSGGGVASYYLADGLGSTTQLTDSAGAITDSYSYDVFGAPRTATGPTANDFRYTGQQRDGNANRGLYFLRARSYDPALGRFLEKDRLPLGNRYAYAAGNPANLRDPSGFSPAEGGCEWLFCDFVSAVQDRTKRVVEGARNFAEGCASSLGHAVADAYRASPIVVGGVATAATVSLFLGGVIITTPESEVGGGYAVVVAAGASAEFGYGAVRASIFVEEHPYTDDPFGAAHDLVTEDFPDISNRCF